MIPVPPMKRTDSAGIKATYAKLDSIFREGIPVITFRYRPDGSLLPEQPHRLGI
jgi:hypothetical protein